MLVADKDLISKITHNADIADGLVLSIEQGRTVVDTACYTSDFGALYEVRIFESIIGSQDFSEPSEISVKYENYGPPKVEYYSNRNSMMVRLFDLMHENHF